MCLKEINKSSPRGRVSGVRKRQVKDMVWSEAIEGRNITLRSATLADAEYTYQIRQDKEKTRFLHTVGGTVEDQRHWLRSQMEKEGDYFFVVERKNGEKIGTTALYNIHGRQGEVGRTLLYGNLVEIAETQLLVNDFAFDICGLNEIVTTVLATNRHILGYDRKFGARKVRKEYSSEFGCDIVYFAMTMNEYKKKREKIQRYLDILEGE